VKPSSHVPRSLRIFPPLSMWVVPYVFGDKRRGL
jgi:hypothetical protein